MYPLFVRDRHPCGILAPDSIKLQPQPNMPLQPTVLWAQRRDRVLLTIDLQDCRDPKVTLEDEGKVSFRGLAHSHATGRPALQLRGRRLWGRRAGIAATCEPTVHDHSGSLLGARQHCSWEQSVQGRRSTTTC